MILSATQYDFVLTVLADGCNTGAQLMQVLDNISSRSVDEVFPED